MKIKFSLVLFFCLILFVVNNVNAQESTDIASIVQLKNLHKVDEGIYRSAQPNAKEFKDLEDAGLKEVLNMRRLHSDDKEAQNTALTLHRIKVRAEAIKEHHLLAAMKIIKNRKGDILIHCKHGSDRTGAVIAMYRITFQNWTKEDAINEMKNGGYGFHGIFANIPKLIQNMDVEAFKAKVNEDNNL